MRKTLPIGNDDFAEIRENHQYFVDKSLIIKDFLEAQNKVTLITRPRRFGKTLNMTMIHEFFDITKDSRKLFDGLAIMDTEYAGQINSRPVIFLTFKDCKGENAEDLFNLVKEVLSAEYARHERILRADLDPKVFAVEKFYKTFHKLKQDGIAYSQISRALYDLAQLLYEYYKIKPLILIDEYDQPIMSSYEHGYHDETGSFFPVFYGSAMKGNPALGQALLTGVQRVAKESIFSQFNNPKVCTVVNKQYAPYFGLTSEETSALLKEYGLELNEAVRRQYDGYHIGDIRIYNPWSVLSYADSGFLDNYWVNTSANFLVRKCLEKAGRSFWQSFDRLIMEEEAEVWLTLDTSYAERSSDYSLWGLLVNAGYLTVEKRLDANCAVVKIPNKEVMTEFQTLVSELSGINNLDLNRMFEYLMTNDIEHFFQLYREIVINCTSYMDAKENAYHMLFLGMCITLQGTYNVTSNIEAGYGRSDITLESKDSRRPHIVIEFKQGDNLEELKEQALQQIMDKQYYAGLSGEIICIGLAHDKKYCSMASKTIHVEKMA